MALPGIFRSPRTLAAAFGARIAASGRVRAVRLLFEMSKGWSLAVTGLMVANAVLPILVLVALGLVIGDLPAAIRQGMSSAGGHRLELAWTHRPRLRCSSATSGRHVAARSAAVR